MNSSAVFSKLFCFLYSLLLVATPSSSLSSRFIFQETIWTHTVSYPKSSLLFWYGISKIQIFLFFPLKLSLSVLRIDCQIFCCHYTSIVSLLPWQDIPQTLTIIPLILSVLLNPTPSFSLGISSLFSIT